MRIILIQLLCHFLFVVSLGGKRTFIAAQADLVTLFVGPGDLQAVSARYNALVPTAKALPTFGPEVQTPLAVFALISAREREPQLLQAMLQKGLGDIEVYSRIERFSSSTGRGGMILYLLFFFPYISFRQVF